MTNVKVAFDRCLLLYEQIDELDDLIAQANKEEEAVKLFHKNLFESSSNSHVGLLKVLTEQYNALKRTVEVSARYGPFAEICESYGITTLASQLGDQLVNLEVKIALIETDLEMMRGVDRIKAVADRRTKHVRSRSTLKEEVVAEFWKSCTSLNSLYQRIKHKELIISESALTASIASLLNMDISDTKGFIRRVYEYTTNYTDPSGLFTLMESEQELQSDLESSDFDVSINTFDQQRFESDSTVDVGNDITVEVKGTVEFDVRGCVEYAAEDLESYCIEAEGIKYELDSCTVLYFVASTLISFDASYDDKANQNSLDYHVDIRGLTMSLPSLRIGSTSISHISNVTDMLTDQIPWDDIESKIYETIESEDKQIRDELTYAIGRDASLDISISTTK